jgi:hypothetical protein
MIMLSHNHARKNSSMCFVSTLIFKLKNGFVDLFKKVQNVMGAKLE